MYADTVALPESPNSLPLHEPNVVALQAEDMLRELRAIATHQFAGERRGHTLQPTAVVNEAWLRLLARPDARFTCERSFRAWAAEVVRCILVDHARAKTTLRRGGGVVRHRSIDRVDVAQTTPGEEVVELHDALNELASVQPRLARVVSLRFFGGMKADEIAAELGISTRTVQTDWALARAWLHRWLQRKPLPAAPVL